MKLTIKQDKREFSNEYENITLEEVKDLIKAFLTIYKLDNCHWTLEAKGKMEIEENANIGLGCLFG